MSLTRRELLSGIAASVTLAVASDVFGEQRKMLRFFRKPGEQTPEKRIGTIEESAKAVLGWLRANDFRTSTLGTFGQFRRDLPFEMDSQVALWMRAVIKQVKRGPPSGSREETFTATKVFIGSSSKESFILSTHINLDIAGLTFGRIMAAADINGSNAYVITRTDSFYEGSGVLATTPTAGLILIFDDYIEKAIRPLLDETGLFSFFENKMGTSISQDWRNKIALLLRDGSVDQETFRAMSEDFSIAHGIPENAAKYMLAAMRILYIMRDNYEANAATGGFDMEAMRRYKYSSLAHELIHAQLREKISDDDQEIFCRLAEFAHGESQHLELLHFLSHNAVSGLQPAPPSVYSCAPLTKNPIEYMQAVGFDFSMLYGPEKLSEADIQGVARIAVDNISMELTGKPFEELVDVRVFGVARDFIQAMGKSMGKSQLL